LTVDVVAPPGCSSVRVHLAGDVDLLGVPALTGIVDGLNGRPVRVVVVDLSSVTFAGSALANFLDALREALPRAALLLHRPSPAARLVVTAAGLDRLVAVSDDALPAPVPRR
jgi:anti-anti-sigma regulatory factor